MEIKEMVVKARKAQEIYEHHFDQDQVDRVIREAARVIYDHAVGCRRNRHGGV